jgi:hypothetical protein
MTRLLKLKHWQLFLLLMGIPIVSQIFMVQAMMNSIRNNKPPDIFIPFSIMMICVIAIFFGWFYALGTNLHKKLPESVSMNLNRFKFFLLVPVIYLLLICLIVSFAFTDQEIVANYFAASAIIIVPLHLFSMFCIFYCLYFISKELKSVEWQRPVTFSDYVGEFFLIWFFPVGIWIIQPRINKLFDEGTGSLV